MRTFKEPFDFIQREFQIAGSVYSQISSRAVAFVICELGYSAQRFAARSSLLRSRKDRSQRGQAMTEYIFLIVLVALVCLPMYRLLPAAIRGYVRPFYYCLSRPIP